ncbi:hypothetical protein BT96DRAFT_1009001 [Gymnopus androsaceus JB14]|uniref:Uncharacterized protein n=1 Tax=Gymnopus androsaceus JB14 TaxID=1447944 RepID=A0A6A4GDF4_9AGAR|nr:hypothetical protein BT96DRAFT_1009001 [Gymnopus androsaceus JB14]
MDKQYLMALQHRLKEDRPLPKKNTHKRSAQEGGKPRRHRRDAENDEDQGEEDQPQPKKRCRIFKKSGDEGASQPQKKGSGSTLGGMVGKGGSNGESALKKQIMFRPAGLPPKKKKPTLRPAGLGDAPASEV